MRRLLLVFVVMAAMVAVMAVPAFATPSTCCNPHAVPSTGKVFGPDTPQHGYVATYKAPTADTHEPPTDASGGTPGSTFNRCAGPLNAGQKGQPAC